MDTKALCALNDSKSDQPVLEGTSNRARFRANTVILNGDEPGTLNESYVVSGDERVSLFGELHKPSDRTLLPSLDIPKAILSREPVKKEAAQQGQADLKRKFPTLDDKLDEELQVDKRPVKKSDPSRPGLKLKTNDADRLRDRIVLIHEQVATMLERHWGILSIILTNLPLFPILPNSFTFVTPPEAPVWLSSIVDQTSLLPMTRRPRAVRMCYGPRGQMFLDRRDLIPQRLAKRLAWSSLFAGEEDETALSEGTEEVESQKRLEERWDSDAGDVPPAGLDGAEEHDRHLVDDYDTVLYNTSHRI